MANKQCAGYDGSVRCTKNATKIVRVGNGEAGVCNGHVNGYTVIKKA